MDDPAEGDIVWLFALNHGACQMVDGVLVPHASNLVG
jgi:hypothetical protein